MKDHWDDVFTRLNEFLCQLVIDSKETGKTNLGKNLYGTQRLFLEALKEGLQNDVHTSLTLKGRQEGISSLCLAIDLFWAFLYPGIQGAIITDTEVNRE